MDHDNNPALALRRLREDEERAKHQAMHMARLRAAGDTRAADEAERLLFSQLKTLDLQRQRLSHESLEARGVVPPGYSN